ARRDARPGRGPDGGGPGRRVLGRGRRGGGGGGPPRHPAPPPPRPAARPAPPRYAPPGKKAMWPSPRVVHSQGELVRATFDSEPIGHDEVADLLYLNFKAPDYAGHVYNMDNPRQAEVLGAVDEEIGRLADLLAERFGDGRSVLIVTADHGQCPEIDANGGVRIDPIQLEEDLNAELGAV